MSITVDLDFYRDLRVIAQAIRDGIPLHEATDEQLREHVRTGSCERCRNPEGDPQP